MKANDILNHFYSVADWIIPNNTVDRIIIGNPEKEIKSILVSWISSFDAVKSAVEGGFDLLITHEPTFYSHSNELVNIDCQIARQKMEYIKANELVVMRCHDVWDTMPNIGIPWALAKFLQLGGKPVATREMAQYQRYDIEPIELDEFAQKIVNKTAIIGEAFIQVIGEGTQIVSKVGIGTGCYCDPVVFESMGCDVAIVCDDGTCFWRDIQKAVDAKFPLLRLNHNTVEEPGMITLTEYLSNSFTEIKCVYFPNKANYRIISAKWSMYHECSI